MSPRSLLAVVAAAVWLGSAAGTARAGETEVSLTRRPDKTYEVSGGFAVDASTTVVWNVLTDYDRIPAFVSSMRSSRVREARLTPEGVGATYHLFARPDFSAPSFFMGRAMKRGALRLLDQVRAEIVRRESSR